MNGTGASFGGSTSHDHHHHGAQLPAPPRPPRRQEAAQPSGTVDYLPPQQPRGLTSAPMAATSSSNAARAALPRRTTEEEAQWSLKDIYWQGRECKIITQNQNGPCSLIALCNILLLRNEITITPPDRPVVSYSYLSQLIAEHLLTREGDQDGLEAALSTLPRTQYGLDVNVGFNSINEFAASTQDGRQGGAGELALFRLCGVPLVHGWLPDPADTSTYEAVKAAGSYNRAQDIVVRGDEVADGGVVRDRGVGALAASLSESSVKSGKQPARHGWNEQHYAIVRQALALQSFLDSSSTQLTYHGLFVLAQELPAGQPVALFRNSHLSVLYKRLPHEGMEAADGTPTTVPPPTLFTLATDSSFLMEDEIVWESLVDVDGASSEFFDGKFRKSTMRQGDYVGRDADGLGGGDSAGYAQNEDADYALAMQIYQNDQERLERHQQRRTNRQSSSGTQSRSRNQQQQQAQTAAAAQGAMFETPKEVFTTMRYELEPQAQHYTDRLVVLSLLPAKLKEDHHELLGGFEGLSMDETAAKVIGRSPPVSPQAPSTNPFVTATDTETSAVPVAHSTNPFLRDSITPATTQAPTASGANTHRLYQHIPLLAQHIERLQRSAPAMCRAYSAVWSLALLEQERSLEAERILAAIESSLASSSNEDDTGGVKGIRVAINKDGSIRVTHRTVKSFPSLSHDRLTPAPLPTVRFDVMPTRVRTMDLEPLVFNKTDARKFYEGAKQRVGADPGVLSGVNGNMCFDVILWNDEVADTLDGTVSAPRKLVTESSLANVVVEYPQPNGLESRFVTPRTSTGMLDGLLRRWLVNKHLVDEEDIELDQLIREVQEGTAHIWLCNSLRGMWKVDLVEGPPRWLIAGVETPAVANQRNKAGNSGWSKLLPKKGSQSNAAAGSTDTPAAAASTVHDQVTDDLYGHKANVKGKKGRKGKDDKKDCIIC